MTLHEYILQHTQDAVLWLSWEYWQQASLGPIQEAEAVQNIVALLLCIPSEVKRNSYLKAIEEQISSHNTLQEKKSKVWAGQLKKATTTEREDECVRAIDECLNAKVPTLKARDLSTYIKQKLAELKKDTKPKSLFDADANEDSDGYLGDDDPWLKCPKWMIADDVRKHGFSLVEQFKDTEPIRYGYYSYNPAEKRAIEITNFSVKPIFHIKAGRDSRHLIEVNNGWKRAVLDVESKAMVSPDILQSYLVGEGNFIIFGSSAQYKRIASHLLQNFRECLEIKSPGWQRYGFFAFCNKIYLPASKTMTDLDEWGVVEIDNQHFLMPAASAVYRTAVKTEDDPYENHRPLSYIQSPISFEEWIMKMQRVYHMKGLVSAAYAIMCIFRDIIFAVDNNFPHLYFFGERNSGKSKCGESINNFFFQNREVKNLNSGTDFAFFAYMSMFRNCVALLNEFDEKVIKPEWFQAIKGVFDGESRQKGSMVQRGKIETQRVESGLVLMGQYLNTADDNSIVTRSIIEPFSERNLSDADKKAYTELKEIEQAGITSLQIEVLQHREAFKAEYKDVFNSTLSEWRHAISDPNEFNQRIMSNWAHLYSTMLLIKGYLNLSDKAVDMPHFKRYCKDKAMHWSKFVRSSDTLSEFWQTLQFMAEQGLLQADWDYRIDSVIELQIRKDKNESYTHTFNSYTKVLRIRLNSIHKLYQESYKRRTGKQGMDMENLLHYFRSRQYYVGPERIVQFKRPHEGRMEVKNTNCYTFLYDELDISLESEADNPYQHDNKETLEMPFGE